MRNFVKSIGIVALLFSSLFVTAQDAKKGVAVSVNSKFEKIEMSKEEFRSASFSLYSLDEASQSKYELSGFKLKYPGQPPIEVIGTKLNEEAITTLQFLKKGDQIMIYDAKGILGTHHQTVTLTN